MGLLLVALKKLYDVLLDHGLYRGANPMVHEAARQTMGEVRRQRREAMRAVHRSSADAGDQRCRCAADRSPAVGELFPLRPHAVAAALDRRPRLSARRVCRRSGVWLESARAVHHAHAASNRARACRKSWPSPPGIGPSVSFSIVFTRATKAATVSRVKTLVVSHQTATLVSPLLR